MKTSTEVQLHALSRRTARGRPIANRSEWCNPDVMRLSDQLTCLAIVAGLDGSVILNVVPLLPERTLLRKGNDGPCKREKIGCLPLAGEAPIRSGLE
jgi:hypothetical protein